MTRFGWVKVVVKSAKSLSMLVLFIMLSGYTLVTLALVKNTTTETSITQSSYPPGHFPKPEEINKDVHFWKRVYTEISTSEGFIHDSTNLAIIYETIPIASRKGKKSRSRFIKKVKKKYQTILTTLARGKRTGLTKEEKRVLFLWPKDVTNKELARARKRLRFQLGQSDKFRAGLIRSGSWKPYILKILENMGLPKEIAALPHVESSFNYRAYSKVGAAGMWQFTRSTGRRYMRVDHVVDERLDPFIATVAAARLLKNNYAVTGSWPLAITAYNHGAAGMRRAAKKIGSKDIERILRKYKSRSFGFASRNFYPSFLAAVEIDSNPKKYFKNIQITPPSRYQMVKLPAYLSIDTILNVLKIDRTDLMASNPALRPAVWNGNKYIPRNYELRIDPDTVSTNEPVTELIANIDAGHQFSKQKADRYHRVRKGQTLSVIAARYRIRMRDLVAANNMRNKHHIRVGQVLILPEPGRKKTGIKKIKRKPVKEQNPPKVEPQALPEDGIYIVQKGDNVDRIARMNGISVKTILKLNKIRDRNKIYPGQKLALINQEEIVKQQTLQVAQLQQLSPGDKEKIPEAFAEGEVAEPVSSVMKEPLILAQVVNQEASEVIESEELQVDLTAQSMDSGLDTSKTTNGMAETLGDKVLEESEGDLLADPSDYSVTEQQTIEIQAAETLGHYAEWLQIRAWDLRRLNRMKYGKPVVVGKHLKLKFKKVSPQEFETQRLAYHKALQEEFFEQNQIVGIDKYRLSRGDSVWRLTRKTYKIPFWLLRQYNPDLDMNRITTDNIITFPKVKQRNNQQS